MGLNVTERKVMVEYKFQKAIRTLVQAKGNIELKYWEVIANRLYYAAYYAVSAYYWRIKFPSKHTIV